MSHLPKRPEARYDYELADVALQREVESHLQALTAAVETTPISPFPYGTSPGIPTLPDDCANVYDHVRSVIAAENNWIWEFDESSYEGRWAIQNGVAGLAPQHRIIWVRNLASANMLCILLHEYGHQLHMDLRAPENEYFAEAFSHVVSACLGVYNPYSATYINHCSKHPQNSARYLRTEASQIVPLATSTVRMIRSSWGTAESHSYGGGWYGRKLAQDGGPRS